MGNLGFGELLMVFAVALVVFGPRKLPEIGRTIGGALREFRRATNDLKNTLDEEVRVDEVKKSLDSVRQTAASALTPVPETVTRSAPGQAAHRETTPASLDTPAADTTAPATPDRSAASE
ncbi:MAG TPA: Sec-independent protein translocase protein TatB [Thermoanaerobaculia bacterium]|nr:Sec-independent protein translocase protein TatB [Thermoanaerobaculia bacterium]